MKKKRGKGIWAVARANEEEEGKKGEDVVVVTRSNTRRHLAPKFLRRPLFHRPTDSIQLLFRQQVRNDASISSESGPLESSRSSRADLAFVSRAHAIHTLRYNSTELTRTRRLLATATTTMVAGRCRQAVQGNSRSRTINPKV